MGTIFEILSKKNFFFLLKFIDFFFKFNLFFLQLLLWPFKDILNHMGTPWGLKSHL
jgi:hypothetical protein